MTFTCGCKPSTYCPTHRDWECHMFERFLGVPIHEVTNECPPCRTARWASVNLDSRATPTRRER